MDRIFETMGLLNSYLDKMEGRKGLVFDDPTFDEMMHVYGTAYLCAAIAAARGLNPKLAFIIGLLHDTGRIPTDIGDGGHGPKGAELVRKLLGDTGRFTGDELDIICRAIHNHSNKKDIGTEYEEVVKDADVVERIFIMKDRYESNKKKRKRLKSTLSELGIKLSVKK